MTWSEEKAKLLLGHRLEKSRIRLNRCLAFIGILLVGGFAYFVAPRYASTLREKELLSSARIEILKDRQRLYFNERFEGYQSLDSATRVLLDVFWGAIYHYESVGKDGMTESDKLLLQAKNVVQRTLSRYQTFLDTSFVSELKMQIKMWDGVMFTNHDRWPKLLVFLQDMRNKLNRMRSEEFAAVLSMADGKTEVTGFDPYPWKEYTMPRTAYRNLLVKYVDSNYVLWKAYTDSLFQAGDTANAIVIRRVP
jgi:hypothetical protein